MSKKDREIRLGLLSLLCVGDEIKYIIKTSFGYRIRLSTILSFDYGRFGESCIVDLWSKSIITFRPARYKKLLYKDIYLYNNELYHFIPDNSYDFFISTLKKLEIIIQSQDIKR